MFHGKRVLLPCLILALITYAVQHLTRGTLSGNGRFGPYGLVLAAEGIYRIVPAAILYIAGVDNLFLYGLVLRVATGVRQHHRAVPTTRSPRAGTRSSVVRAHGQSRLAVHRLGVRAAAVVRADPRHPRARHTRASATPSAPTSSSGSSSPASRSCSSRRCRRRLLPKLAGLIGSGRHDEFKAGPAQAHPPRGGGRHSRRRGLVRARPDRRRDPLRQQVPPRRAGPRASSPPAAACSSWR